MGGTQNNRLDETVLLSTQNACLNIWVRITLIKFPYRDLLVVYIQCVSHFDDCLNLEVLIATGNHKSKLVF